MRDSNLFKNCNPELKKKALSKDLYKIENTEDGSILFKRTDIKLINRVEESEDKKKGDK